MKEKSYYRSDIDGLRAIAVLSVLLYHFNVPGFTGGFVGVDIFFVISGYLIISIISRELSEERFSLSSFWERRIRRIFPALIFVTFATTLGAYLILLFPPDFISFAHSLIAQSAFLSNMFFMRTDDYFAAPAETLPLLHLWSLSLEEQFYILIPFLLLLFSFFRKKWLVIAVGILASFSFAYNIYLVEIAPAVRFSFEPFPHLWGGATNLTAGFYFLLPRAWELLLGGLLAITAYSVREKNTAQLLSLLGVTLLGVGIFGIDEQVSFPGLAAVFPVLGTALLIAAHGTHPTYVSRLLSTPLLVGIGLISYSLYLWHWPLLVLTQQYLGAAPNLTIVVFLFLASFLLAFLTHRFIETPFRKKRVLKSTRSVYLAGLLSLVLMGALGYTLHKANGLPQRAPEAARQIAISATDDNPRVYECFKRSAGDLGKTKAPCLIGNKDEGVPVSFVLWGDSHANAIMPAFEARAKEENRMGIFFAAGGCAPLWLSEGAITKDTACSALKDSMLEYIKTHEVDDIFMVSAWKESYPNHASGTKVPFKEALEHTLTILESRAAVTLVHRVPEQTNYDVRSAFLLATRTSFDLNTLSIETGTFLQNHSYVRSVIAEQGSVGNNSLIDPSAVLCEEHVCPLVVGDLIVYKDTDHISTSGALLISPLVMH